MTQIDTNRPVTDFSFVAFDFETTGLHAAVDRIVEIGAVSFQIGAETGEFGMLVDPGVPIHPEAARVSGITAEMLIGKPSPADVLPQFMEFVGDAVLIAHNAEFDTGFLRAELERAGMPTVTNRIIDTIRLAQRAFPRQKSYSLQNLVQLLSIPENTAHRAVDDSRQAMRLFERCVEEMSFMGDLPLTEVLT